MRILKADPRFAALVILALGLGIGANSALFTVVNSLLLRPLPFSNADELVEVSLPRTHPPLKDLKPAKSLADIAGFVAWGFNVLSGEGVRNTYGFRVTANLFTLLGVQAAIGRTLRPDEDGQPVVMLSYDYWRRTSGDPGIIGKPLELSGETYTVVGVLPADFWLWVRDSNLFVPTLPQDGRVVARLNPGFSASQAEAEVSGMVKQLSPESASNREGRTRVIPLSEAFVTDSTPTVLLLQATVGLVLLITCANIGNLLLVRAAARRKEFAVRTALGATQGQLMRQLLSESAVLASLGGMLGLLVAGWSAGFLQTQLPANISRTLRGASALSIDYRVIAFTAGVSLLAVLLFGLAPALSALRVDVMSTLRDVAKGSTPDRQRFGQVLVIVEVGLALMLLIGAGLTVKSLVGLEHAYRGFSPDHVLRALVDLSASRYGAEQRAAFVDAIVRRLEALPGVEAVGALGPQLFPFGGPRVRGSVFAIQGRPESEARAEVYTANPAYFRSVRIPLLKGRLFTETDTAASEPVAMISEVVAKRYWGQQDPIGSVIRLQSDRAESPWVTVVGVVGDVKNPVALDVQPTAYRPVTQNPLNGPVLMVRTSGDPMSLVEAVRREIRAVDPTAPEIRVANLEKAVWAYVSPQRFTASLLGVFALLGLLLASVGVYGVMRYWVAARIPEIGMRMALGANRGHVLWLVLRRAGGAALIGVAVGVIGAVVLRKVIASQLHGVSPTDPSVFVVLSGVVGVVALGAALLPALWAARVDPLVALRHE